MAISWRRFDGEHDGLLPREICDRARIARDRRFDGRFFTGVLTTGIYCRPVCPVMPARSANVKFFPSAAAAEAAGFRPCLRCRPEAAPGSPAWRGSGATVSRALSLINRGFLDDHQLPALAALLGVGTRHVTRLFLKYCGAAPGVVARSRRVQLAKRLLEETVLPMADVAFAAGFSSLRRFNTAFRETYGRAPSQLRRLSHSERDGGAISLRLYYRPPYDWPLMLRFLSFEATPGVESVSATEYARTVSVGDMVGWLAVRAIPREPALSLSLHLPDHGRLGSVIDRAQTMLDLFADPEQIAAVTSLHARSAGIRLPGAWDGFEVAVRAIVDAEVGKRRARDAMDRLARDYGVAVSFAARPSLSRAFPEPAQLTRCIASGLSTKGQGTLRRLARATVRGRVRFDGSMDFGALTTALVHEVGFTRAAAAWVGTRTLSEPDADLTGRFALSERQRTWWRARSARDALRPWRTYAALHLWLSNGRF